MGNFSARAYLPRTTDEGTKDAMDNPIAESAIRSIRGALWAIAPLGFNQRSITPSGISLASQLLWEQEGDAAVASGSTLASCFRELIHPAPAPIALRWQDAPL